MRFRVTNHSTQQLGVGAEPYGFYTSLSPKETLVVDADDVEDVVFNGSSLEVWVASKITLTKGEEVVYESRGGRDV